MSRSTWYYNMNALKQGDRYAGLKENIRKIYHYHKGRYGYRRITLALRKQGLRINHKTVQRLMAELSLRSVIRAKKYRAWKGRTGEAAPNILSRNFGASKANEKWVTDVTEFPVQGKKLYLSSVLDLFNREVIAYSLSERPVMEIYDAGRCVPEAQTGRCSAAALGSGLALQDEELSGTFKGAWDDAEYVA